MTCCKDEFQLLTPDGVAMEAKHLLARAVRGPIIQGQVLRPGDLVRMRDSGVNVVVAIARTGEVGANWEVTFRSQGGGTYSHTYAADGRMTGTGRP